MRGALAPWHPLSATYALKVDDRHENRNSASQEEF